jgi:alpha-ribazole phosphatase
MVKAETQEAMPADRMSADRIRLYLVRHGQVVGHEVERFNGHTDVDISEQGRKQLEQVARHLQPEEIHCIYCSDLKRALASAEIIAQSHHLTPVALKELREMNLGIFDGLTFREVKERFENIFQEWRKDLVNYRLPQGECLLDIHRRVDEALGEILKGERGRNIVIVAHGGVNRIILSQALGMDPKNAFRIEQYYGCLNVIDYYTNWTVVKLVNMIL